MRGHVTALKTADEATLQKAIFTDPLLQKFLLGKNLHKMIVVPGKLVNLVMKED